MEIATVASESKVIERILPAMLLCGNVFNMKGNKWLVELMQPTVFTAALSPLDDLISQNRVHSGRLMPRQPGTCLGL